MKKGPELKTQLRNQQKAPRRVSGGTSICWLSFDEKNTVSVSKEASSREVLSVTIAVFIQDWLVFDKKNIASLLFQNGVSQSSMSKKKKKKKAMTIDLTRQIQTHSKQMDCNKAGTLDSVVRLSREHFFINPFKRDW